MPSAVLGSGPIGFTDTNGKQQSIPLSLLYFDNGLVKADKWPLYSANTAVVDALLKSLVAGEFLKPAPAPPPKPAMVLKAAIPGIRGNTIQVTFSNIVAGATPPTSTTFEAEITAKATYSGLSFNPASLSFVGKVLGVGATLGTSPGLVRVKEPAPSTAVLPKAITTSTQLAGGGVSAKSSLSVAGDPSGTAFTLEAWKDGAEGNNIKITIPDVNSEAQTFTLVVEWTQPKITSIALSELPSKLAGLAGKEFVIEVSKPEGATDFGIPALGTITLSGGADATGALPAGAVAFST
jgi:hypothetical protein